MPNIIELFKKQTKKENLVFPQIITDLEIIKRFDRAFENRSPYTISLLYRMAARDADTESTEKLINNSLQESRKLTQDDKDLINNIIKEYQNAKTRYVIFNSIGNLMFISELLDTLKKKRKTPKVILMTCLLWLYHNMVEIIYAHLSEVFYIIAQHKNDKPLLKLFATKATKEEHLTRGELYNFATKKKIGLTTQSKNTFLSTNDLRNRLAHANCFYDSVREEIILSSQERLTLNEFKEEFRYVRDFLYELVFKTQYEFPE
jgi:hypothetical protein